MSAKTMTMQVPESPITPSLTGSFIRPANTPFETTIPNDITFVKMAGNAILRNTANILQEVGCYLLFGSNILFSSCSSEWFSPSSSLSANNGINSESES